MDLYYSFTFPFFLVEKSETRLVLAIDFSCFQSRSRHFAAKVIQSKYLTCISSKMSREYSRLSRSVSFVFLFIYIFIYSFLLEAPEFSNPYKVLLDSFEDCYRLGIVWVEEQVKSSWGVHTTSTTLHIPFDIKISFVQPCEYLIAHRRPFQSCNH